MKPKLALTLLIVGLLGGIGVKDWYEQAVAPIEYVQASEIEPKLEPKVVLIEIDYTSWNKKRVQQEILEVLPAKFLEIAECESGTKQYHENGNVVTGIVDGDDTGLFQINTRYHLEASKRLGMDIYTPVGNIAYAKHLYDTQGTQPWSASKGCWE